MPLVSIIITSYNYGSFLRDSIDSALNQRHKDTEVIVVDDGSTDNSREIIAGYRERITAVMKENGGQGSAFNAGFSVSRGDVVIFLDSDDKLSGEAVEEIVKVWRDDLSKVHYRLRTIDCEGKAFDNYCPPLLLPLGSGDLRSRITTQGVYRTSPTSGNAFGRSFLSAVLPIPEGEWRLCPDAYLHALAPFYGMIAAIEKPLGYYRVHGSNASAALKRKSYTERLEEEIDFRNKCKALIMREADRMNLKTVSDPTSVIARKLVLLLESPAHRLVRDESQGTLVCRGLCAVWRESEVTRLKQMIVSALFVVAPFIPRRLAKRIIFWYIYPEKRPTFLRRLIP